MKINGSTNIDLSLSNFDIEIGMESNQNNTVDLGIARKNKNNVNTNIANLQSNLGPLQLKLSLLTEKDYVPDNFDDMNLTLTATYNVDNDVKMGLKYETDGNQNEFEILSGVIDSSLKINDYNLNLSTENILFGYKKNQFSHTTLHGNKIHPSISLMDDSIKVGLIHEQKEEIDDYGNKNEFSDNKISLGLSLDF